MNAHNKVCAISYLIKTSSYFLFLQGTSLSGIHNIKLGEPCGRSGKRAAQLAN